MASVNAATPSGLGRSMLVDPERRLRVESVSEVSSVLTDVVDLGAIDPRTWRGATTTS